MDPLIFIGLGLIVLLFLTGAPLAVAFASGSCLVILFSIGFPLQNLAQLLFSSIASYSLLACPFFILAGNLVVRSGAMEPLRDFMRAMLGHWSGGLPVAAIIFGTVLGSISGSTAACLAILGTIVLPILTSEGYDRPFASAIALCSGQLGLLIPPSLFFIIFGALNQISIPDLFLAGIGPGLLGALLMSIAAVIVSRKRGYKTIAAASWAERGRTFFRATPVIFMPILILGGIYGGFFSPTQAASVCAIYVILIGVFVYRGLSWPRVLEALVDSAKFSSMIYFLIIGADVLSKVLAYVELPQMITNFVFALDLSEIGFLLVMEAILLVMGFFFSSIPMIIVVLPLFLPTVQSLGIDPVFYGSLAMINVLISEITPPMGPQLWFAVPICGEKMGNIMRESWLYLLLFVFVMVLTTFIPGISMYLVHLFR